MREFIKKNRIILDSSLVKSEIYNRLLYSAWSFVVGVVDIPFEDGISELDIRARIYLHYLIGEGYRLRGDRSKASEYFKVSLDIAENRELYRLMDLIRRRS